MKHLLSVALGLVASLAITTSCDDDRSPIGGSLIDDKVEIVIDSAFTLTGHSTPSPYIDARTTLQLLGGMTAGEYGSFSSSVITQFMPTMSMDTIGVTEASIDAVHLIMRVPVAGYVGDSMAVMGVTAYPLLSLPDPINSSTDPKGHYSTTPLASTFYSMDGANMSDSLAALPYRYITLDLGVDFGKRMLRRYKSNPETFATPSAFTAWFPGLYIATTFGAGRVAQIDSTVIATYFHQTLPIDGAKPPRDTIINRVGTYLGVTPEVLTNNNMTFTIAPSLKTRIDAGEPIIVAPTGYDVELTFPAREIVDRYRSSGTELTVINTLSLTIPVDEITNDYGITPPSCVLLIRKNLKDDFFSKSLLPDNINSFYATYDVSTRQYRFNDMRGYILDLLKRNNGDITTDDEQFVICPVTIGFEKKANSYSSYYYYYYGQTAQETSVVASVTPYVNRPSMARLMLDKAKIKFTYSVQKLNF